jgi:ABC-2 type transport system permease protein
MFLIMPISAVFYPVAILPGFLQPVAWALPPTYVFEGMRALLIDHVFRTDLMIEALAINAGLMAVACVAFLRLLDSARQIGSLMAIGE